MRGFSSPPFYKENSHEDISRFSSVPSSNQWEVEKCEKVNQDVMDGWIALLRIDSSDVVTQFYDLDHLPDDRQVLHLNGHCLNCLYLLYPLGTSPCRAAPSLVKR